VGIVLEEEGTEDGDEDGASEKASDELERTEVGMKVDEEAVKTSLVETVDEVTVNVEDDDDSEMNDDPEIVIELSTDDD